VAAKRSLAAASRPRPRGGEAVPAATRSGTPLPRAVRLPEQVTAALHQHIVEGALPPGSRLPTEKELCETYGVSRAVIREAVGMLKHDGLVTSRQGAGAFVAERGQARSFRLQVQDLDDADEMRNLVELLVAVEVAVAEKAAQRRTAQQLAAIGRALDAIGERVRAGGDGVEQDMLFHRSIAAAAGNPFFVELNDFLDARVRKFIRVARTNTARQQGLWTVVQAEHAAIHAAIAARDPAAARRAAEDHLRNAARRLRLYRGA
jgi:DNA-binding FadR family transcriptional regulator